MTKKEWDDEFSQKITELTGEIWTGRYDLKGLQTLENKIFAVIRKDREHQQEEMLKRFPDIADIIKGVKLWEKINGESNSIDIAKATYELVKDKLKEE